MYISIDTNIDISSSIYDNGRKLWLNKSNFKRKFFVNLKKNLSFVMLLMFLTLAWTRLKFEDENVYFVVYSSRRCHVGCRSDLACFSHLPGNIW